MLCKFKLYRWYAHASRPGALISREILLNIINTNIIPNENIDSGIGSISPKRAAIFLPALSFLIQARYNRYPSKISNAEFQQALCRRRQEYIFLSCLLLRLHGCLMVCITCRGWTWRHHSQQSNIWKIVPKFATNPPGQVHALLGHLPISYSN